MIMESIHDAGPLMELLSCFHCRTMFSQALRPKMLVCKHVLCPICIEFHKEDTLILCPACGRPTVVCSGNFDSLATCMPILDLLDAIQSFKEIITEANNYTKPSPVKPSTEKEENDPHLECSSSFGTPADFIALLDHILLMINQVTDNLNMEISTYQHQLVSLAGSLDINRDDVWSNRVIRVLELFQDAKFSRTAINDMQSKIIAMKRAVQNPNEYVSPEILSFSSGTPIDYFNMRMFLVTTFRLNEHELSPLLYFCSFTAIELLRKFSSAKIRPKYTNAFDLHEKVEMRNARASTQVEDINKPSTSTSLQEPSAAELVNSDSDLIQRNNSIRTDILDLSNLKILSPNIILERSSFASSTVMEHPKSSAKSGNPISDISLKRMLVCSKSNLMSNNSGAIGDSTSISIPQNLKQSNRSATLFSIKESSNAAETFPALKDFVVPGTYNTYFLDFEVEDKWMGRVIIRINSDAAPLMAANFSVLCDAAKTPSFKNCKVFQCWKDESIITGDIQNNDGTGGKSVLNGEYFEPDESKLPAIRGAVGMRRFKKKYFNQGKVSSQFRIMLKPSNTVTGIFGMVAEGIDVVESLSALGDDVGMPKKVAKISNCGKL